MSDSIGAVILAAGLGSRFRAKGGEDKLMARCLGRDGVERSVLEQVLVSLPASLGSRVLVTTEDRQEAKRLAEANGCRVVLVTSSGMGDSIAAGVKASFEQAGWLVVLGDMPFVLASTFEGVVESIEASSISVPAHGSDWGHPVGFGRSFGSALVGLSGDRGAKGLFASALVRTIPVVDPGVLWDVDVPAALVFESGPLQPD